MSTMSGEYRDTTTVGGVKQSVKELVSTMRDKARNIQEKSGESLTKVRDYAKENPGKTILISAAVGLVLGSVLLRRR